MRSAGVLCTAWLMIGLAVNIDVTVGARKNWVLLVAGSNHWGNYRHQADVCHAYQIAHAHGIPDEQIVVMMYDDIADNAKNPYPGIIINQPNGPNVYPGVPKDYTGKEVNGDVFYKVLQGDKEGVKNLLGRDGKVIDSGPEDHVFVFYSDHGSTGIVAMPADPTLIFADELNEALKKMHDKNRFAKLVFYLESCMSGSMFDGILPDSINVYATTASRPDECSWGCYYDEELETCLGDEYSVQWMENCDEVDISKETLQEQYEIVRENTEGSHPMQYGDLSYTSLTVDQFLGGVKSAVMNYTRKSKAHSCTLIDCDDLPIFTLQQQLAGPMGSKHGKKLSHSLEKELWLREKTQEIMEDVARIALPRLVSTWAFDVRGRINDWSCYRHAIESLMEMCPRLSPSSNEYIMKRLGVLANLCNSRSEETVMEAVKKAALGSAICEP